MTDNEPEDTENQSRQRGGDFGRLAGKFVKNAGPNAKRIVGEGKPRIEKAVGDWRPRVQKAVDDYRPRAEQAGRDAVRYAQDHQDELKSLAMKGVRMRLGPLGMALDALGVDGRPQETATPRLCSDCRAENSASARFCAECGAALPAQPETQQPEDKDTNA